MKKYYVLIVVLALILALLNIPDLSVSASESDDIYFNDIFIGLGDMRKFFDDADYRQNVQNAIDKGFNEGILLNCNDDFFNDDVTDEFTQDFYTFLSEPDNVDNGFCGASRNNCKLNVGRGFVQNMYPVFYDFLENPQNYKYFVYITRYSDASVGFYLYLVSDTFDGELSFISTDGGYIIPSEYYGSCTQLTFTLTYNTSQSVLVMNNNVTNNISPSEPFPMNAIITNSSYRCMYSDLNVYFTYRNKGYAMPSDIPTENYDTFPHIYNTLKTVDDYSCYIFDRREFTSGYPDNVTVDTDPVSIDKFGAWGLDMIVTGYDGGEVKIACTPTDKSQKTSHDILINYSFECTCNYSPSVASSVLNMNGNELYNKTDSVFYTPFKASGSFSQYYVTGSDVTTFNAFAFFSDMLEQTSKQRTVIQRDNETSSGGHGGGVNFDTSVLNLMDYFVYTGMLDSNTVSFGSDISASYGKDKFGGENALKFDVGSIYGGGVSSFVLTVTAEIRSNSQGYITKCDCTYDLLSGRTVTTGTQSTNNNTDVNVVNNLPTGFTSGGEYYNYIQTLPSKTGGNGGGNSSSTATGGTGGTGGSVTNNNQDTINVKSNWQYFVETNPDDNNPNDNVSAVDQFREAYEIVTTPENNPINSDVVQFLFTSDLWSIYPFNLIMGFSGMLVTVGIFTAILRLFRR